ncbi:MAG: hypothetical protein VX701_05715 [Chloroflexota bacterium]|nr:hypothetical protein [Chloroflexota bacterium]
MKIKLITVLAAVVASVVLVPSVFAHGFGERYDLPTPLSYFLVGAAAMVVLSFVLIGLFIKGINVDSEYPRFNLYNRTLFIISGRLLSLIIGCFSVVLLLVTLYAGLWGTATSINNFAPVFVWVVWWVGVGYIVALVGNIWAIANPWNVLFNWAEKLFGTVRAPLISWPAKFDAWPALCLFLLFAWLENVYTSGARPYNLAILIILYSIVTWAGMLIFGKHVWLKKADPFSVLFALFSRFAPTEVRVINTETGYSVCKQCISGCAEDSRLSDCIDCYECWELADTDQKQICLRPWAVGLSRGERVSTALVAFHVTALATVTFDGFSETSAWVSVQLALWPIIDSLPREFFSLKISTSTIVSSIGILFIPAIFALAYIQVCRFMSITSGNQMKHGDVVKSFVFSLVPIALAYNLAHYLSFLLITGQQIVPLISDPFGFGWDIFGTYDYKPNISIIDARFAWNLSIVAIVTGHVISVCIAHIISLRRTTSHGVAVNSQFPMLGLMVFYTAVSLWIIAQPIVE